ncbi:aldo-keto reductase family 1 member A1-like [Xylocopa sonorina]|uniref:aldo-keto reductase family 1 member A1-like n=1 Tax=Xylocopa sonorina TaxID=1818115 RepID=UPI00403B0E36
MEKKTILLPNGQSMPVVGFGTWQATEKELQDALNVALEAGYRHIDTAAAYQNESAIGNILKKWFDSGKLKRSEIFIVTKVPPVGNRPEDVEYWMKRSLQCLQLDYVDLYLVHVPFSFESSRDNMFPMDDQGQIKVDCTTDHVKIWAEMERQVECGRTKAIGLSNFNISQIENVLKHAKLKVSMLQVELHVYFQQRELVKYCREKNIPVTAYSSLGTRSFVKSLNKAEQVPDMLKNDVVLKIAAKRKKTPAQVLLRFIVQQGIVVIPKSTNRERIKENIQIFDFELDAEDMKQLKALDMDKAGRILDFSMFKGVKNHPQYPF